MNSGLDKYKKAEQLRKDYFMYRIAEKHSILCQFQPVDFIKWCIVAKGCNSLMELKFVL